MLINDSAESLSARLLKAVVAAVSELEGEAPRRVALTHPANWGTYKKDLYEQAVRFADLPDVVYLTEPEAAAIHYASQERVDDGSVVAVYDLGGGTFDAAVLRNTGEGFELMGDARGIEQLGGVYFDEAVFTWVVGHLGPSFSRLDPDDPSTVAAVSRLRRECVEAKENLSWDTDTAIPVALPNQRTEIRLTRGEFENLIRPALDDTVDAMRRALTSADVTTDELRSVLLVGGSSRIPLVGQMLMSALGRPVAIDVHPKHAVALGAALLSGRESPTLATPVDSAVATLAPPAVTRAGRTTVTSPTGTEGPGAPPPPPPPAPPLPTGPPGGPAAAPEAPGRSRWPLLAGAAATAAALVVAAVVVLGGGGDDDDTAGTDTSTTTTAVVAPAGGVLPVEVPRGEPLDEDTIVYTQLDPPFWNIWTIDADGSEPRALTREQAAFPRLPVIAPDRRSVAYSLESPAALELRVIDTGGEGDRLVIGDLVPDARATWSPDGSRMAVVTDRDGSADITIVELATGEVTNLTNSPEDEGDPSWSPDGESIAYWSRKDGNQDIYVIPVDGGAPRRLTSDPGDDADPSWKPDGSAIAYSSQREGDWEIFVMGPDGGGQVQLTDVPADDQDPAWSSDGTQIAFETKRDTPEAGDQAEIYVMAADGSGQRNVTNRPGLDIHPAWGTPPA